MMNTMTTKTTKPLLTAFAAVSFAFAGQAAFAGNGKHMEGNQPKHDSTLPHSAECSKEHAKQHMVSDAWLQGRIETTYLLNRHLNNFAIDSDVKCGNLTLSGYVESDIDRDLAVEIAKGIPAFRSVESKLEIKKPANEKPTLADKAGDTARSFAQNVEEATTTAVVKTRLLVNGNVHGTDINVDTKGDTVTLSGTVATDAERELAENLAGNTNGVAEVRNDLKVKPDVKS